MIGHPLFAGRESGSIGNELGAQRLARGKPSQHAIEPARGHHRIGPAACCALRRAHLGDHAALGDRGARPTGDVFKTGVDRAHRGQELRGRVAAGIRGVQALLVGEDDQGIGIDQIGDQRAEGVVVAELDLVGHHRVVLVDDRDDREFDQRSKR